VVLDSAVCGISKPDPAIFTLALAHLGVPPRQALFVGDSLEQDVIPARAAGLRSRIGRDKTRKRAARSGGSFGTPAR
jgi:FMN phosphatase YigB (HAD superfamily)